MTEHLGLPPDGPPNVGDEPMNTRFIAYVLEHHQNGDVAYMTATSRDFFIAKNPKCPEDLKAGHLYCLHFSHSGQGVFSPLSSRAFTAYTRRELNTYTGPHFHSIFIRSLMLGVNVQNYLKHAATVQDVEPLVIRLPRRPDVPENIQEARFVSEAGDLIEVNVYKVVCYKEHLELTCSLISPTSGLNKNSSRLLFYPEHGVNSPDSTRRIINELYRCTRPIVNRPLIECLYGDAGSVSYSKMDTTLKRFLTRSGHVLTLSAAQSEAVHRFLQSVEQCPAFGVLGCPGSGKTLLMALMMMAYNQAGLPGLQLALAPNSIALDTIEQACVSLDSTNLSILRLEELDDLGSSPLSIMNHPEKENNRYIGMLARMKEGLSVVSKEEQRAIRDYYPTLYGRAVAAAEPDILIGTIDQALWMSIDKSPVFRGYVSRVLVDESNQVSEATLTALHQSFPDKSPPMFAFFGDNQQLAPKGYQEGSIESALVACSAMGVLQRKRNVPIVRLRESFRHTSNLMPYDQFYGESLTGARRRGRNDERIKLLEGAVYNNCALVAVDDEWEALPSGDSYINDYEIRVLLWTVEWLREEQIDPNSVLIITYFDAQKELARAHVPEGYEVVTVEESQGREADVTIVLTTLNHVSASTNAEFMCERNCVVATSRHREALIVIGPERLLASTGPWMTLLQGSHFTTVVYDGNEEEDDHDDRNDDADADLDVV